MAESVKKGVPVEKTGSDNWMEEKLRLNKKQFMVLLKKVKPHFARETPENLDPFHNLMDALKFLVTGEGYVSNMQLVLHSIYVALEEYYTFPDRPEKWLKMAQEFETTWNVKNTVGAMISKRVQLDPQKSCESLFVDPQTGERGEFMISAVDAKYRIYFNAIGGFGITKSPDSLLRYLKTRLQKSPLPKDSSNNNSYVFFADEGFSFLPWIRVCNDRMPKEYNEEIKRALKPGQIAHEIIFSRFGVLSLKLKSPVLECSPEIYRAAITLHNYFLAHNPAYAPEYKDTKKWVDAKIEKIPRSVSVTLPTTEEDDDWMKKIFLSTGVLKKLLKNKLFGEISVYDMTPELQLKMCLRFLVSGELNHDMFPVMKKLLTAFGIFLNNYNNTIGRKCGMSTYSTQFRDKFQLEDCGGALVTKRCSLGSNKSDPAIVVVLVIAPTGRLLFYSFQETNDVTAWIVQQHFDDGLMIKNHMTWAATSMFFVASEKKIPNDFMITPKCPRDQCPEKIQAAVEYGQRVLVEICSIYSLMNFNAERRKHPIFELAANVSCVLHNWFVANNPDYAKAFQEL